MFDLSMPILIVEDMSLLGRIVQELLKKTGFQNVDVVAGGHTALQRLRSTRYGLIISDWDMRPMTGLDLLKQVRSDDAFADTRFIMMTGSATYDHVIAAKNAGADGFIAKPFTAQVLREKLARVFSHVVAVAE